MQTLYLLRLSLHQAEAAKARRTETETKQSGIKKSRTKEAETSDTK